MNPSNGLVNGNNGSLWGNGTNNVLVGAATPASPYGSRRFHNELQAHSFINTALNNGEGYVGTVAGGIRFQMANENRGLQANNGIPHGHGQNNLNNSRNMRVLATGSVLPMHPYSIDAFNRRPNPSSALILVAEVQSTDRPNLNAPSAPLVTAANPVCVSPSSSQSSVVSGPFHGGRCHCAGPVRCVCHMYCHDHAYQRCPVHGLGLASSEESGWESSSQVSRNSHDSFL